MQFAFFLCFSVRCLHKFVYSVPTRNTLPCALSSPYDTAMCNKNNYAFGFLGKRQVQQSI